MAEVADGVLAREARGGYRLITSVFINPPPREKGAILLTFSGKFRVFSCKCKKTTIQ
jgi:hypothetical protein